MTLADDMIALAFLHCSILLTGASLVTLMVDRYVSLICLMVYYESMQHPYPAPPIASAQPYSYYVKHKAFTRGIRGEKWFLESSPAISLVKEHGEGMLWDLPCMITETQGS